MPINITVSSSRDDCITLTFRFDRVLFFCFSDNVELKWLGVPAGKFCSSSSSSSVFYSKGLHSCLTAHYHLNDRVLIEETRMNENCAHKDKRCFLHIQQFPIFVFLF
jgi:hypothetical protein